MKLSFTFLLICVLGGEWMMVACRSKFGGHSFNRPGAISSLQLARNRAAAAGQEPTTKPTTTTVRPITARPTATPTARPMAPTTTPKSPMVDGMAGARGSPDVPPVDVTVFSKIAVMSTTTQKPTTTRKTRTRFRAKPRPRSSGWYRRRYRQW